MDQNPKNIIQIFCIFLVGGFLLNFGVFIAHALAAKTLKLNLALEYGDKYTAQGKSMQMWADLIKEKSDGKIKVNIFYLGELGGQQEMLDQLVKGNIDMMLTWPHTSYDERLGINYIPYLVLSWEDAYKSYGKDGWLKKLVEPVFAEIGLKYFGPYPEGFGGVATKKRYATNFKDAQGLKVRSPPIFPLPQTIKSMGFQPIPIDWSDVYASLQTGVVDGDSSNVIFWDYEYFRDQIDYYVHSEHNFSSYSLLMNNNKWASLSSEYQKIIEESAIEVINKQFANAKAEDEKWIKTAQEAGIKYIRPTPEEKLAWVKRVRAEVWPLMEEKLGKEVMDTVRENASVPVQQ